MKDMNQLRDLLRHEILDLCSAEEQIIEALPKMFEKASDPKLKQALSNHLRVTEEQRARLDQVLELLQTPQDEEKEQTGIMRLFKGSGKQTCKGTKGLIEEGESVMKEDMTSDVMDAAIIACAQKIEHYEICAYGTTRAYAEELNLNKVERLLRQTLDEEYEADDLLTEMAVGRLNREAVNSGKSNGRNGNRSNKNSSGSRRSATSSSPKGESRSATRSASKTAGAKTGSRATTSTSKSKSTQSAKKKTRSSSR